MLDDAGLTERMAGAPGVVHGRGGVSRRNELMGAGLLVVAGSFLYPYVRGLVDALSPGCLFHRLTGLPCLLCGMTRSLAATAHGRWEEAFRMHLLGPPLFFFILAATVSLAAEKALSRRLLPRPGRKVRRAAAWGILALLAAAWVARLALFGVNV